MILDGKKVAAHVREQVAKRARKLIDKGTRPGLGVIRVGEDAASATYVRNKQRACEKAGILSKEIHLPQDVDKDKILEAIKDLGMDPTIHGILVQLPLPSHIPEAEILDAIDPAKDADGFHLRNIGALWLGRDGVKPCTPAGIMEILKFYDINPSGKKAVIVGRSQIVGKPMAALLIQAHATVTVCHSKTQSLSEEVRRADILIVAAGQAGLVRGDWIKPGATVVDVGIHRVEGSLTGDVVFSEAVEVAGAITPVPGGVGPMTVAMLLSNTVTLAEHKVSPPD